MELFFSPDITGNFFLMNEQESKHVIRVLRFKKGDKIFLTDGKGTLHEAAIENENPKACEVKIIRTEKNYGERNYHLHIAIAPTKNIDRFEWFLEKVTEIGVDEITPLVCEHSERREVKPERLNKVIIAAMKQSVKAYLPHLNPAKRFSDFVLSASASQKFICICEAEKKLLLKNLYLKEKNVLIMIGPEGDFSKEENLLAQKNNFRQASLGEARLRTETAGVVVCSMIAFINQ